MLPLLALRAPELPGPGRPSAAPAGRPGTVVGPKSALEASLAASAMKDLREELRLAGATAAQAGAIADKVEAFLLDDAAVTAEAFDTLFRAVADQGALPREPMALSSARHAFADRAARELVHALAPQLHTAGFEGALRTPQTHVAQDWLPVDPGQKFVRAVTRFLNTGRWPRKRVMRKVRRYLFSSSWFRE